MILPSISIAQVGGFLRRFILVFAMALVAFPSIVAAAPLPQADLDSIDIDSVHYKSDYVYVASGCQSVVAGPGAATDRSKFYVVGDSIGGAVSSSVIAGLATAGWAVKVNALDSRALSGGVTPDGLTAIAQDQAYIATASTIVVELGTNTAGFTVDNVNKMIDTLRGYAPNASIYWIDTAVVNRDSYALGLNDVNAIIAGQSALKNFKVISWNKAVFGAAADPTNMIGGTDSGSLINLADNLNVHPTAAGITAFTKMMSAAVGSITGTPGGSGTGADGCTCSASLSGGGMKEKIWFYLLGKGLSPVQVAGLMGNIQSESAGTFDPRIVEFTFLNSRNEVSVAGQPSSLDDFVPPDRIKPAPGATDAPASTNGQPGYGIVQFTFPTYKQAIRDRYLAQGAPPTKLGVDVMLTIQLDYLWELFTTTGLLDSTLTPLRAATTTDEASDIVLINFERPGVGADGTINGTLNARRVNAAKILIDSAGFTGSPPTSSTCTGGVGNLDTTKLYEDSSAVVCDPRTISLGNNFDGYYRKDGVITKVTISLCALPNFKSDAKVSTPGSEYYIPGANGFTVVNSRVSGAFFDLVEAAHAAGLLVRGSSSGFRSNQNQIDLCNVDPYCPSGDGRLTAVPGTSPHQMGLAIDFYFGTGAAPVSNSLSPVPVECEPDAAQIGDSCDLVGNPDFDWMAANAKDFGATKYIGEFWHWEIVGKINIVPGPGPGPAPGPVPTNAACTNPSFVTTGPPSNGQTFGQYYVHNNMWNDRVIAEGNMGVDTLSACSHDNWSVLSTQNKGDPTEVKSYPNVHKDYNNLNGVPFRSLNRVTSTFSHVSQKVGGYDAAYDIWFDGVGWGIGTEYMIWTDYQNQRPLGSKVETVTVGGGTFDAWYCRGCVGGSENVISLVSTTTITSGTFDITAMVDYAAGKGWMNPNPLINQLGYGIEFTNTGGTSSTFIVNNFSITD